MELIKAHNVVTLMRKRELMMDMRTGITNGSTQGWSLVVNDKRFPIPTEVKRIFAEAVDKALDHIESEIEKL